MTAQSSNEESTFSSQLTAEGVPNAEEIDFFKKGTDFWKVRAFNKWYRRKYFLNVENQQIIYQGSNKFSCGPVPTLTIDIADINEIRKGWQTDTFNKVNDHVQKQLSRHPEKKPLVDENFCFSILYGRPSQTLDLVASDGDTRDSWVNELTKIIERNKSRNSEQKKTQSLRQTFINADKDQDKALTFDDCIKVLKNDLNLKMPSKKYVRGLFDKANIHKTGTDKEVLDPEEFKIFCESICKRVDLELIMKKFGKDGNALMGPEELSKFLLQEQKIQGQFEPSDFHKIIKQFEGDLSNELTLKGFTRFMVDDKQQYLFNAEHTKVYQDMSQPISHYYIASSHNTYLIGNQLSGESSIDGYIFALKRGCRCVELDLWDGDDGEPIIYHGHTFVSKIKLKDVLADAIKPYAFKDSQYPLILSLENHCCLEQQEKVAVYLKTILGDMLYTCTPTVLREMEHLPSPENLRGKVIVKAKKLPEANELDDVDDENDPLDSEVEEGSEEGGDVDKRTSKVKTSSLSKELSDVIGICRSVHFKNFEHSSQQDKCYDIVSISENKALTLIEEHAPAFVDHTKRNLVRIYPKGIRTGSSNYKPIPMWNVGAQIVALNYQTADKPNLINAAKFMANGNCGYVLKPKFMLEGSFDPNNLGEQLKKTLHLRIISGQCLPRPANDKKGEVVDPYVVVKIHGHPEDKQKYQTKVIENNGFNPIWDNGSAEAKPFEIPLKLPELSFLHFIVYDSDQGRDDKLGQSIIPFSSIQEGYRHVNLMNKDGRVIDNASLFVHIVIS